MSDRIGGGFTRFFRYETSKEIAEVSAPGYFDRYQNGFVIGDIIDVYTNNGSVFELYRYEVTDVAGGVTTITQFSDIPAPGTIEYSHLSTELQGVVGPPTTPPTTGQFRIDAFVDNSRTVTFSATVNGEHDRYAFYWDVDGTPAGDAGVSLNFTDNLQFDTQVPSWATHSGFLHVRNKASSIWSSVVSEVDNGSGGFDVQANDTIDPVFPVNAQSAIVSGLDASTQMDCSCAAATDTGGSGVARYDAVAVSNTDGTTITINDSGLTPTFSGLTPGDSYVVVFQAFDAFGNSVISNSQQHTTASTVTAGIIAFTLADYSATDSSYVMQPVLERTTGTTGAIQVTWSTVGRVIDAIGGLPYTFDTTTGVSTNQITLDSGDPWAAQDPVTYSIDGGAYTTLGATDAGTYYVRRISAGVYTLHPSAADAANNTNTVTLTAGGAETHVLFDGEDVAFELVNNRVQSWADADGANKTLSIKLTKRANQYNNIFDVQIDNGSNSDGSIGAIEAANCLINSSLSGVAGFQQDSDGTDNLLVIDLENYDASSAGTDPSHIWNVVSDTRASPNGTGQACAPTVGSGSYGSATSIGASAPYFEYNCNFTQTGVHYFWLRCFRKTSSTADTVHLSFDGGSDAGLLGFHIPTVSLSTDTAYQWIKTNVSSTDRTLNVASTGAHTIRLTQQDYNTKIDKLVVTTNASYDPNDNTTGRGDTKDDYYGPDESSTAPGGGGATDNPSNPSDPWTPLPTASISPISLSPSNTGTDISTTVTPTATFATGVSSIFIQTSAFTTGGNDISFTAQPVNNTVQFVPDSPLSNSATYTITATGHAIDPNGDLVSLNFGTWSFTTQSGSVGGVILQSTSWTGITGTPRLMTQSDALEHIHNNSILTKTYGGVNPDMTGSLWLVDDPDASGRGKVMEVQVPAGGQGNVMQMRRFNESQTDLYMAMDVRFPVGYKCPNSVHLHGFFSADDNIPHTGSTLPSNDPNFAKKALAAFNLYNEATYNRGQGADGAALACYVYDNNNYRPYFWNDNPSDSTWRSSSSSVGQVVLPLGRWVRLELRAKMNTFTGSTPNADGIIEGYMDGVQKLNVTGVTFLGQQNLSNDWNTIWNNITYGGAGAFAYNDDTFHIDNVILSTGPITH